MTAVFEMPSFFFSSSFACSKQREYRSSPSYALHIFHNYVRRL